MTTVIIHTEYIRPHIPTQRFNWSAIYEGYESGDPVGIGVTERDAILDLVGNHEITT